MKENIYDSVCDADFSMTCDKEVEYGRTRFYLVFFVIYYSESVFCTDLCTHFVSYELYDLDL